MKKFLSYIGFVLSVVLAEAQSIEITSVNISQNGNVVLSWTYTGSSSTFVSYRIERMNNATRQYVLLDTISNISTLQYIDNTANADIDTIRYRVSANGGSTFVSDCATSIRAIVNNTSSQNITAFIRWNTPFASDNGTYNVFRQKQGGQWFLLGSTSQNNFNDTIRHSVCNDTLYYKVEYRSQSRNANSTTDGSLFNDPQPTTPCSFDVVSVNPQTQEIELSWQASPDADIMGYFICQGSPCMALDTVWGQNSTTYICPNHSTDSINTFRIYAFDSCFTASALTNPCNNIVLSMSAQHCTRNVNFSWNEYINMPDGIDHYNIFIRYDAGAFNQIGNVSGTSPRNFAYTIPAGVRQVFAYVEAVNTNSTKSAKSNIRLFDMMTADTAKFLYIKSVSVSDNNDAIDLKFFVDNQFNANDYTIYRSTDMGPLNFYKNIPYTGQSILEYTDNNVDAEMHYYSYCLSTWDECELLEKKSQKAKHIVAKLLVENGCNIISWMPYNGWGNVLYYNVLRKNKGETDWTIIATITDSSIHSYTDNVSIQDLNGRRTFYKVAAYLSYPDFSDSEYIQSQTISHVDDALIWVANAFTPHRNPNRILRPTLAFVEDEGYLFQIYNRFGVLVFETTDRTLGWDGKYKGKYVPNGYYVYLVKCIAEKGQEQVKTGTVLVIE